MTNSKPSEFWLKDAAASSNDRYDFWPSEENNNILRCATQVEKATADGFKIVIES